MTAQGNYEEDLSVLVWEPEKHLTRQSSLQARLSRGFLRSEPARWFPGFAVQWVPLLSAFGIDAKVESVTPALAAPQGLSGYAGSVDNEPVALLCDDESTRMLMNAFCPGASVAAQSVFREYLARRLLTSLALSWSGPESSVVLFDRSLGASSVREAAAVCITLIINNSPCRVWVLLGRFLVERLDGLWKRQMRSTAKQTEGTLNLAIEITQLAVPPSLLTEYMRPRAVIDLEVAMSDRVLIRNNGKPWSVARLVNVDGKLGFELLDDVVPNPRLPDGTTRVAIEAARVMLDAAQSGELSHSGSIWETDIRLSSEVSMVINEEKVASAELMLFEGRFALRVK